MNKKITFTDVLFFLIRPITVLLWVGIFMGVCMGYLGLTLEITLLVLIVLLCLILVFKNNGSNSR